MILQSLSSGPTRNNLLFSQGRMANSCMNRIMHVSTRIHLFPNYVSSYEKTTDSQDQHFGRYGTKQGWASRSTSSTDRDIFLLKAIAFNCLHWRSNVPTVVPSGRRCFCRYIPRRLGEFESGIETASHLWRRCRPCEFRRGNWLYSTFILLFILFKNFYREALVWYHLKHDHILPFLGIDKVIFSPHYCMVTPWLPNGHILQFIKSNDNQSLELNPSLLGRWVCYAFVCMWRLLTKL